MIDRDTLVKSDVITRTKTIFSKRELQLITYIGSSVDNIDKLCDKRKLVSVN